MNFARFSASRTHSMKVIVCIALLNSDFFSGRNSHADFATSISAQIASSKTNTEGTSAPFA